MKKVRAYARRQDGQDQAEFNARVMECMDVLDEVNDFATVTDGRNVAEIDVSVEISEDGRTFEMHVKAMIDPA